MRGDAHDRLAKVLLRTPEGAAAFLRTYLPSSVREVLDLDALIRVPGSSVGPDLRERLADVVLRAGDPEGHVDPAYVLIEHQRTVDPWMLVRLWEGVGRIWRMFARPSRLALPPVAPVVIYNGAASWTPATGLDALPGSFDYTLVDLRRLEDARIIEAVRNDMVALALLHLKHAGSPDMLGKLHEWKPLYKAVAVMPGGRRFLAALAIYLVRTRSIDMDTLLRFGRDELDGLIDEDQLSTRQWFRHEGRKEGREEGRMEGRAEALRAALLDVLAVRFGPVPDGVLARVSEASADELAGWHRQALVADDLAHVFAMA